MANGSSKINHGLMGCLRIYGLGTHQDVRYSLLAEEYVPYGLVRIHLPGGTHGLLYQSDPSRCVRRGHQQVVDLFRYLLLAAVIPVMEQKHHLHIILIRRHQL